MFKDLLLGYTVIPLQNCYFFYFNDSNIHMLIGFLSIRKNLLFSSHALIWHARMLSLKLPPFCFFSVDLTDVREVVYANTPEFTVYWFWSFGVCLVGFLYFFVRLTKANEYQLPIWKGSCFLPFLSFSPFFRMRCFLCYGANNCWVDRMNCSSFCSLCMLRVSEPWSLLSPLFTYKILQAAKEFEQELTKPEDSESSDKVIEAKSASESSEEKENVASSSKESSWDYSCIFSSTSFNPNFFLVFVTANVMVCIIEYLCKSSVHIKRNLAN